jgi:hypothetical protein
MRQLGLFQDQSGQVWFTKPQMGSPETVCRNAEKVEFRPTSSRFPLIVIMVAPVGDDYTWGFEIRTRTGGITSGPSTVSGKHASTRSAAFSAAIDDVEAAAVAHSTGGWDGTELGSRYKEVLKLIPMARAHKVFYS